jgi:CheY-like chemotaxis protein
VHLPRVSETTTTEAAAALIPEKADDASLRILVVDDNVDAARSLAKMLEILGHQALLAHDGRQAVEVALREHPNVILLDLGLPGLNGYQVCQTLRKEGLTGELIAAVTGYGQDSDRRLTAEAGFDVHLVKPVAMQTVQELLVNYAAKK